MENHTPLPMTPFDTTVTSFHLQMMKLILPYTPVPYQRLLAFFIKFSELQNALHYFGTFSKKLFQNTSPDKISPLTILEDMKPYIGKGAETIDTILMAMNLMDMMNGMEQTEDFSDMMDMVNLFSGFSTNVSDNETTPNIQKGNDAYEQMDRPSGNENA